MPRKAGVKAEDTRASLLAAAARVFALKGYDGASISDISNEAGLSSGAIYAHYGSKAQLFAAVVVELGDRELEEMMDDVPDIITLVGSSYGQLGPEDAALMIEAIVASKRHPEVAQLIRSWIVDGEHTMTQVIHSSQSAGVLDPVMSPDAMSRFATFVGLGASLAAALDLPPVVSEEWTALIERLVDAIRQSPAS
jgi:AcrR family transcriptional regulator